MAITLHGSGANINPNKRGTIWVVDNFYEDPHAIRNWALEQSYAEGGFGKGFMGYRSYEQFIVDGTKEAFESIIGEKITQWTETHTVCGRFQYCTADDKLVYHCDEQRYAAAVYLTPNAPYCSGTSLLAHKRTGMRHTYEHNSNDVWVESAPTGSFTDGTQWEEIDIVANVFNRLVIWDGHCPHAARNYFGFTKEKARLFHIFFFDTVPV